MVLGRLRVTFAMWSLASKRMYSKSIGDFPICFTSHRCRTLARRAARPPCFPSRRRQREQKEEASHYRKNRNRSPPLELGFAFFEERVDGLAMVLRAAGQRLAERFAIEGRAQIRAQRVVEVGLHVGVRDLRTRRDLSRECVDLVLERRRRHDPVHYSELERVVGAEDVPAKV